MSGRSSTAWNAAGSVAESAAPRTVKKTGERSQRVPCFLNIYIYVCLHRAEAGHDQRALGHALAEHVIEFDVAKALSGSDRPGILPGGLGAVLRDPCALCVHQREGVL